MSAKNDSKHYFESKKFFFSKKKEVNGIQRESTGPKWNGTHTCNVVDWLTTVPAASIIEWKERNKKQQVKFIVVQTHTMWNGNIYI